MYDSGLLKKSSNRKTTRTSGGKKKKKRYLTAKVRNHEVTPYSEVFLICHPQRKKARGYGYCFVCNWENLLEYKH